MPEVEQISKAKPSYDSMDTTETETDSSDCDVEIRPRPHPEESPRDDKLTNSAQGLGQVVVGCIVINYISAGYILLPSAFAQAGILLSTAVLAFVSLQSYSTALFLMETSARAEALETSKENHGRLASDYRMVIRERKFELPALARLFLGERWARFFCFTTAFDLYGITWTFCSVFASNMSEQLPILANEHDSYRLYVAIFFCIAVPLSCVSILDQVYIQLTFLGLRILMVALMLGTIIWAQMYPEQEFFADFPDGSAQHVTLASFGGLLQVIQICIFATAFQFAVPGMAAISKNRRCLPKTLMYAVGFIFVTNLILSLWTSAYFGEETEDSSNLGWTSFHGGSGASTSTISRIVSFYIVLMAAIDGLAVYPLNTIPLGEGLMGAFCGTTHEPKRKTRLMFHLLASLPQAAGAFFLRDLGVIAQYAGVFTLLSYTFCPSWLQLASRRRILDLLGEFSPVHTTEYGHPVLSSPHVARALLVLSTLLIIAVASEAMLQAGRTAGY